MTEKRLFTIRDMEEGDLDAVVEIARQSWKPVFVSWRELMGEPIFSRIYEDWQDDKESQIRRAAAPESGMAFLVAVADRRVAGFVSWRVDQDKQGKGPVAEIGNNAVDPEWQNRGIASGLYAEVIRRCRAADVATIKVTTGLDPSHAPARRAYEKAGFGSGIPMVTYWQDLKLTSIRETLMIGQV